jgi:iodotyrosine deiodinase
MEVARAFESVMTKSRTVRDFSERPVSLATIESTVRCAGGAAGGANKKHSRFVAMCDPAVKRAIRTAAENEDASRAVEP